MGWTVNQCPTLVLIYCKRVKALNCFAHHHFIFQFLKLLNNSHIDISLLKCMILSSNRLDKFLGIWNTFTIFGRGTKYFFTTLVNNFWSLHFSEIELLILERILKLWVKEKSCQSNFLKILIFLSWKIILNYLIIC